MNKAVGWSAVYVIVAFLSYLLTFWSWSMNIYKNVQPQTVTIYGAKLYFRKSGWIYY